MNYKKIYITLLAALFMGCSLNNIKKDSSSSNQTSQLKEYYIVKEGDTLSKISTITKVEVNTIKTLNSIESITYSDIGKTLYLKPEALNNKIKLKFNRELLLTATAYTSEAKQTDKTPFLAAWNNRIKPGMKIIAVSPDLIKKFGLTNGVVVKIKGLKGYYVVKDKMNSKFKKRIDIYMGLDKYRAIKWGKRRVALLW